MGSVSWEALRKEARRLENEIDAKLVSYSKLGHIPSATAAAASVVPRSTSSAAAARRRGESPDTSAASSLNAPGTASKSQSNAEAADQLSVDIDSLLIRLSETVDNMSRLLHSSPANPASAAALIPASAPHMLERHTEILTDYKNEFRKTRSSIMSTKEHELLLSSVRKDMASRGLSVVANGNADADAIAAERAAISGAGAGADAAVGAGMTLREELERQRAMFASMVDRMEAVGESVPSVHRLIGQIRRKKKRDLIVLAVVVAFLTFLTFLWKAI